MDMCFFETSGYQPVGHGPLMGHRAFCGGPQSHLKNYLLDSKKF